MAKEMGLRGGKAFAGDEKANSIRLGRKQHLSHPRRREMDPPENKKESAHRRESKHKVWPSLRQEGRITREDSLGRTPLRKRESSRGGGEKGGRKERSRGRLEVKIRCL